MVRSRRMKSSSACASSSLYTHQEANSVTSCTALSSRIWQTTKQKSSSHLRSFARRFCSCCIDCDYYVRRREAKSSAMAIGKEARAVYRMAFLTASQWSIVMNNCEMQMQGDGEGDMDAIELLVTRVMEWRRSRGDFGDGDDDDEEDRHADGVFGNDEVPRLCDDMEGVNEAVLQLGFLKTDLQVECLLRGIPYQGRDSKASLISKLLHHKHFSCLTSNSFHTLAEQSK